MVSAIGFQGGDRLRDLRQGVGTLVLEVVVLHAGLLGGGEDRGLVELAVAQGHIVIGVIFMTPSARQAFADVLHVHERDAGSVFLEDRDRVGTGEVGPEHIEFEAYVFGPGLVVDKVVERAFAFGGLIFN